MTELTFHFMGQSKEDEKNKPVAPFETALNCPFCASNNITVREDHSIFWGHCMGCDSDGPTKGDRKNALELWNKRKYREFKGE